MGEIRIFYEKETPTGYQGLPRELCQQLIGLSAQEAMRLERIYRDEKERELAGAGGDVSPKQIFQDAVYKYKVQLEAAEYEDKLEAKRPQAK